MHWTVVAAKRRTSALSFLLPAGIETKQTMVRKSCYANFGFGLVLFLSTVHADAAAVTGWLKDTSFGGGATAALTNANTNSPILGNGASNNADNTAIYAPFPTLSLSNGQRITLSASAQLIGTSSNPDFRWGLFKNDGVGAVTGGWLGYMASAESSTWSKDPSGGNFANATFASIADGRAVSLGQTTEPNGIAFAPGMYDFTMTLERYDDELDVQVSITNDATGFAIVSPSFTESDPSRLTFAFDRVGLLAGSALDADQIHFSNVDVSISEIVQPTLQVHSSGLVVMTNPTGEVHELTQYEITSNAGSLNSTGWTSFDDRENNDPVGSGWDEASSSNANVLAEVNLLSHETLVSGEHVSLGDAFIAGGNPDLAFHYTADGQVRRGVVEYLQSGDYNRDGSVDTADYVLWRKTYGTSMAPGTTADGDGNGQSDDSDYDVFTSNFGRNGSTGGQAMAAPEPSVWALTLLAMPSLFRRVGRSTRKTER
jgi:hypothetical protein